jgi:hypothetical protein
MSLSVLSGIWTSTPVEAVKDSNYAHVHLGEPDSQITFVIWDTDKARELAAALVAKADEKDARDLAKAEGKPVANEDNTDVPTPNDEGGTQVVHPPPEQLGPQTQTGVH